MKNKILMSAFALSIFMISCTSDRMDETNNKTEVVQKNAAFSKLPKDEQEKAAVNFFKTLSENSTGSYAKPKGFCHTFSVSVGVGIITVETSVTICCTTATMNCTPVPKSVFGKAGEAPIIEEFKIMDSSVYITEDGEKIQIKKGVYDVTSGEVQLELEYVK